MAVLNGAYVDEHQVGAAATSGCLTKMAGNTHRRRLKLEQHLHRQAGRQGMDMQACESCWQLRGRTCHADKMRDRTCHAGLQGIYIIKHVYDKAHAWQEGNCDTEANSPFLKPWTPGGKGETPPVQSVKLFACCCIQI